MKARVAFCVPTYERSDVIKDFLTKCSKYFVEEGIDIYFYDSSLSDDTRRVLEDWPEKEHIFYNRLPPDVDGDEKVLWIYQCYGLKKDYDFIWMSQDAIQIEREGLHLLMLNLQTEFDIICIMPQFEDIDYNGIKVFTDPNEFLQASICTIACYGHAILNKRTVIDGTNWKKYEKFFKESGFSSWGQINYYFGRLAELSNIRALFFPLGRSDYRTSQVKLASGWRKQMFDVFCYDWPMTVEELPDIYKDKDQIVFKFTSTMAMHSLSDFTGYRREGIYNYSTYSKYRNDWRKFTEVPRIGLVYAALAPVKLFMLQYRAIYKKERKKFEKFYKAHRHIAIYGASEGGYHIGKFFEKYGYHYDFFCCTNRKPGKNEYCGHPVYEFREVAKSGEDIGFIVAMKRENFESVLPMLLDYGGDNCYFYNPGFEACLTWDLGYRGFSSFPAKRADSFRHLK